jgi:hypothetical protein
MNRFNREHQETAEEISESMSTPNTEPKQGAPSVEEIVGPLSQLDQLYVDWILESREHAKEILRRCNKYRSAVATRDALLRQVQSEIEYIHFNYGQLFPSTKLRTLLADIRELIGETNG